MLYSKSYGKRALAILLTLIMVWAMIPMQQWNVLATDGGSIQNSITYGLGLSSNEEALEYVKKEIKKFIRENPNRNFLPEAESLVDDYTWDDFNYSVENDIIIINIPPYQLGGGRVSGFRLEIPFSSLPAPTIGQWKYDNGASPDAWGLNISWSKVNGATEYEYKFYFVYHGEHSAPPEYLLEANSTWETNASFFSNDGGDAYRIEVRAIGEKDGRTVYSDWTSAEISDEELNRMIEEGSTPKLSKTDMNITPSGSGQEVTIFTATLDYEDIDDYALKNFVKTVDIKVDNSQSKNPMQYSDARWVISSNNKTAEYKCKFTYKKDAQMMFVATSADGQSVRSLVSANDDNYFKLGVDSNQFVHIGLPYTIDDKEYKSKLYKSTIMTWDGTTQLYNYLNSEKYLNGETDGVCHGIATSMCYANQGYIDFDKYVSGARNYWNLGDPRNNTKFKDMIVYYHLLQLSTEGKASKTLERDGWHISSLEKRMVAFFSDLINEAKESQKTQRPFVFSFKEKDGNGDTSGHSVVVCGYTWNSNTHNHEIKIYDENSYNGATPGDYSVLYVPENMTSFDFADAIAVNEGYKIQDTWIDLEYYGLDKLYNSKYIINSIDQAELVEDSSQMTIQISYGKKFRLENMNGKWLSYDGRNYSGNMNVYDCYIGGLENYPIWNITIDNSDNLTLVNPDNGCELIAVIGGKGYAISSNGAESIVLKPGSVKATGSLISLDVSVQSDKCDFLQVKTESTGNVEVIDNNDILKIESKDQLKTIQSYSYDNTETKIINPKKDINGDIIVDFKDSKSMFSDIHPSDYFFDAVLWAVENSITNGTSSTTFSPNNGCTRAQVVTFLWRAAGKPSVSSGSTFSDVPKNEYYTDAVTWAVNRGITNGVGNNKFDPNATCTRAQIVTFLWRYKGSPSASTNSGFSDISSSQYYAAPVTWAVKNGITNGVGNNKFDPNATCTRGQVVTFLYRSKDVNGATSNPDPQPKDEVTGITLSPTSLRLQVGESGTISTLVSKTGNPDTSVAWSSSDSSVVTIQDGTVKAVGKGNATITAKAGNKNATCTVTVCEKPADPEPVDPTPIIPVPVDPTPIYTLPVIDGEITDSWGEIIESINEGTYKSKYSIGDTKELDLGSEGVIDMQIAAFDADELADGSGKAAITWISKQCLKSEHRMNPYREKASSSGTYVVGTGAFGGWKESEMRSWLKSDIKPLIPSTVRNSIKTVIKYSTSYSTSNTKSISYEIDTISEDDVWIPSCREIFGYSSNFYGNGPVYTNLFANDFDRIKYKTGDSSASWWRLRSASNDECTLDYYGDLFNGVNSDGSYNSFPSNLVGAVVLGFCL